MRHSVKDQILVEGKSLLFGYPKFIFSGNDDKHLDGIPVFVFHTIDPSLFESQLLYLKSNGYKTLSVHEFYDALSNPGTLKNNKAVLLTIDDARSSVWRYAYPLLKKYEANAAIFIIPGLTEKGALRKNLSDVWNGKSNFEEIDKSDPSDETLCTWEEISEMYNSGIINIESHSLFHREIFSSSKLIDFYTDHKSKVPYRFPASPYLELPDSERNINADDYLGLPLFETSPLMSALQQLIITEAFKDLCRKI
jgi:peptidoglycan/xylan/chitin deacetylase (PgdA/CDA1 family)